MSETAESDAPAKKSPGVKWKKEIEGALKVEDGWRKRSEKIVRRYREEQKRSETKGDVTSPSSQFNILYSNISVLKPAIYQTPPRAVASRRYDLRTQNPEEEMVMRQMTADISTAVERVLSVSMDLGAADEEIPEFVLDSLLVGRGLPRVRYEPTIISEPVPDPMTGEPQIGEDGEPVMQERIAGHDCWMEHVYWADFLTAPVRKWTKKDQPPWIAFRHLFSKEEAEDQFDEKKAAALKFDWTEGEGDDDSDKKRLGGAERAEVWEIWELRTRKIYWLAFSDGKILDAVDDPLGLETFYPCPRPLYAAKTSNTLVPIAEYEVYYDLAVELDSIQERISKLTDRLRVVGAYDATSEALKTLLTAPDGDMVAVDNFMLLEGAKLDSLITFLPIENIIKVLAQLHQQRDSVKMAIFEVIGISDILRGQSNPHETLGAQQIKTQFGTLRIDDRKRHVAGVLRETLRLMAELVFEKYDATTIQRMSGVLLNEQAMGIMRDDRLRGFMIDIETDSTVAADETAAQEASTKLLTALSQLIAGMTPAMQAGIISPEEVIAIVRFAVKPFRGSRVIEEMLDKKEQQIRDAAKNPQPAEENPDEKAEKMKLEGERMKQETEKIKGEVAMQKGKLDLEKADKQMMMTILKAIVEQEQPQETGPNEPGNA